MRVSRRFHGLSHALPANGASGRDLSVARWIPGFPRCPAGPALAAHTSCPPPLVAAICRAMPGHFGSVTPAPGTPRPAAEQRKAPATSSNSPFPRAGRARARVPNRNPFVRPRDVSK
jgi:hypothetical protein